MRGNKINLLLHPKLIIFALAQRGFLDLISDAAFLKLLYRVRFSRKLNLRNPKSYNEKLQYLKIHDRNPKYPEIVDKYSVRSIVQDTIGDEHLVPIVGIYNSPDEIVWDNLPQQYILKCTHGTHCSIICKDKGSFNTMQASNKLQRWLKHNYFYDAREWPYKMVKPRIMIEELLPSSNGNEPLDIKIMCFDGKPSLIVVHRNITNEDELHTINLFTTEWEPINVEWDAPIYTGDIPRPERLDYILELAEKLSSGYPHVRVDFMISNGNAYFGELTLYPGAGFKPFSSDVFDLQLGKLINLENAYEKNGYK